MIKKLNKKLKIANKNLIDYLFKEAETSEKLCLYGGFWLGYETSFEKFYAENLRKYKFYSKNQKNNITAIKIKM